MAEVRPAGTSIRVFNPINPKRRKPWTQRQAAERKDQAEQFVRDVLEDDDRADEIADMSVEEYAAERGKELAPNPPRKRKPMKRKVSTEQQQPRDNPVEKALETTTKLAEEQSDLYRRIRELEQEKESLQDKLDEIADIVECDDSDCTAEDHLEDIAEIVAKGSRETGED
jgi:predicted RNase H-like nuclease (RuvC/YqgF family)